MSAAQRRAAGASPAEPGPGHKTCPYCAEVIRAAAVKCRYCGSELPDDAPVSLPVVHRPPLEAVSTPPDTSEAPEAPSAPVGLRARLPHWSWGRRVLTVCLVLALAGAGAGLWLVGRSADHSTTAPDGQLASPGARAAIMAEAVRLTETVMSYDATKSGQDIAAAERLMTPQARTEYEANLPAAADRTKQAQLGIAVTARVASMTNANAKSGSCQAEDCAVSLLSATDSTASVLLFVNQSAKAKGGKNTVLSPTWQRVDLVKQDGTWLIAHMQTAG